MSKDALRFERVEVTRALGIRHGDGFALDDCAPGVNLVHGPNGSGKTTTVRALQEMLWPGRTGLVRPTLAARLVEGARRWHVDVDAGHASAQCVGEPGRALPVGPPSGADRYRLALHELVAADDAAFATTIVRESQGGVDLAGAVKALGFAATSTVGRSESRDVASRRDDVQRARERAESLEAETARLPELRLRREDAVRAGHELEALDRALEHAAVAAAVGEGEARLASLPPALERLRGDERERLDELDRQRQTLASAVGEARLTAEAAERDVAAAGLPTDGVDREGLRLLRATQRRLQDAEAARPALAQACERATSDEERKRRRLGSVLAPERLDALETLHLRPLGDLARRVDQLRAAEAVLDERERWLAARDGDGVPDEERLRRGVAALHEWLASESGEGAAAPSWVGLAASLALGALGLVLAVAVHAAWALATLVGLLLLGVELVGRRRAAARRPSGADPRVVHRHSFDATRLPPPARWDLDAVQERLRALAGELATVALEHERAERRRALQPAREALAAQRMTVDAKRRELEADLGVAPALDPEWLPLFVETLGEWQRSRDEKAAAERATARSDAETAGMLAELARGLAPFGYPPPRDAHVAGASLDDLDARRDRRDRAADLARELRRRIREEHEPALARIATERGALLARLGLRAGDEHVLDDWLARLPERRQLAEVLTAQRGLRDGHARALAARRELLTRDRAALETARAEAAERAGSRDEITQKIAEIEARIAAAKHGHDLGDALAALAEAEARLATARDVRAGAAVGAALGDWVRTTAIERSRPLVFRRAQELLLAFTRGGLVLELDDQSASPRFLARRGGEVPRPVDQLSTGERVQLLIAVRLAFLEQDEAVQLPLVLDEALGVSDDERAGAIVEAVKAIAAEGRQVFYFTAQHDEIGKWLAHLGDGVPYRVFDLAECRRLAKPPTPPLAIVSLPRTPLPAPTGLDYAAYGQALRVPPLDPRVEKLGGLHLWHVLDDAATLHRLLGLGISTWGALQALCEHGGAGLVDAADEQLRRAAAVAGAIEAAFEAWRIGRGRPVDRAVLVDSGCVSETFLERVVGLAAEVGGDARRLLASLDDRVLRGWRTTSTASLRAYLQEQGHLPDEPPLSPEALRVRVLAAVADDLRTGRLAAPERLERVFSAVGA